MADVSTSPRRSTPTPALIRRSGCRFGYYAAVQAEVDVDIIDEEVANTAILAGALSHVEPAGSIRVTPSVDVASDRMLVVGIRGVRLTITSVIATFKHGGNKTWGTAPRSRQRSKFATARWMPRRRQLLNRHPSIT